MAEAMDPSRGCECLWFWGNQLPRGVGRTLDGGPRQRRSFVPFRRLKQRVVVCELPKGVWGLSANSRAELIELLRSGIDASRPFDAGASVRLTAAAKDADEQSEQVKRALRVLEKGQKADLLRARAIYLEEDAADGKVAFLFTGQASQYLDMGLDLAEEFEIVRNTF